VFDEIKHTFSQRTDQRKEYGAQRRGPNNQDIISQTTGTIKEKLQGYNTYALPKVSTTTTVADNNDTIELTIDMMKNMGNMLVKISATGDNCFSIKRNETTTSTNICTKKAQEYYNPTETNITFELTPLTKNAGSASLYIELCTPKTGNTEEHCITKTQIIHTLPGVIKNIDIYTDTNIVMEGSYLPIKISAQDAYGNNIKQSTQSYTIQTNH